MKGMGQIRRGKRITRSVEGGFGGSGRVGSINSLISQKLRSLWHWCRHQVHLWNEWSHRWSLWQTESEKRRSETTSRAESWGESTMIWWIEKWKHIGIYHMFYTLFDSNKYQLWGNISAASFRNLQHFLERMGLLREQNAAAAIILPPLSRRFNCWFRGRVLLGFFKTTTTSRCPTVIRTPYGLVSLKFCIVNC